MESFENNQAQIMLDAFDAKTHKLLQNVTQNGQEYGSMKNLNDLNEELKTTVDSSIYSLPPTSTKQPSKLQQMSSKPGNSNKSARSSILHVIFITNYLT